jgi:hypothetical protein
MEKPYRRVSASTSKSPEGRQFELEAIFHSMAKSALADGWTEDEIAAALIGVAASHAVLLIERRGAEPEFGLAQRMLNVLRGAGKA